jgi:hypothetical protein
MEEKRRRTFRIIAWAAVLGAFACMVPTIRSCGDVALGFPTVAVANVGEPSGEFRPLALAINVLAVGAVAAAFAFFYLKTKRDAVRSILRWGFAAFAIYQLLVVFGYVVMYPILLKSGDRSIGAYASMGYVYFIYPFFDLVGFFSRRIPAGASGSAFFGDSSDIPMRIGWLAMSAAWFGAGIGVRALVREAARRNEAARSATS